MLILSTNWGNAITVTLLGFSIVFIVLCLLIVLLVCFGFVAKSFSKSGECVSQNPENNKKTDIPESETDSAAIAMALHLYYADIHDKESYVITIKDIKKDNTSWNSKIYGINNLVR